MVNSLVERVYASINGVKQAMFFQSTDVARPVPLYLHGGPGMSTYYLNWSYPTGREESFTAVGWEQRSAEQSYIAKIPAATMTVQQAVEIK